MASFPQDLGPGAFIPTTEIFDVDVLNDAKVGSPEFNELLVRLQQYTNDIALVTNIKDTGYYAETEFVNGQVFFPNLNSINSSTDNSIQFRQVFRKVINFGALPNAGAKSVPHGITITSDFSFTRIYGTASDTTGFTYIPLPYASPVDTDNIELSVDSTNVTITTGSNRSNFDITYVILEYIKQ